MKQLDIPPVWLAGALALAWWIGQSHPLGLSFGTAWVGLPAGLLLGGGIILIGLAVIEMRKWRTPIMPGQDPTHLVTSGIFKRMRNPIYLADVMILLGLTLYWDAPLALPLAPLLLWVLERRFVEPEERRLRQIYKTRYHQYTRDTRRWV